MTVLVAFASKHGATAEIAQAIGEVLESQGVAVEVRRMEEIDSVMPYDALVLGSAIYMGNWLRVARDFVDGHAEAISQRPTWLFSSGPIAGRPAGNDEFDGSAIVEATHAREHHVFGGRLDRDRLGLMERAITSVLHAPSGDYREWDAAAAWATAIARALVEEIRV
jgi:menaquinone-dependent protoporphyrinogen oxidase